MTFAFKQTSADFQVYEELPFALAGKGEALYVYIEKRNMTTQEVILHLRKKLKLSRLSIGIAGLKDKKAIARQWISIYDRALKQAGGERLFVDTLAEIVKIVEVSRHTFPLNLSTPITNRFYIAFRAQKNLGQEERAQAQEFVQKLLSGGYLNLYGEQRFGIMGRNSTQGWEIVQGSSKEKKEMTKADVVFKIQALSSQIFNEYAEQVYAPKRAVIDGDILTRVDKGKTQYGIYEDATKLVFATETKWAEGAATFAVQKMGKGIAYDAKTMVPTWPVVWRNLPMPPSKTLAGQREAKFLEQYTKDKAMFAALREHKIFGLRRALWVTPTKANATYSGDDLHVSFSLPSGAYASIVFDQLHAELVGR